jgi:hypothetical protein
VEPVLGPVKAAAREVALGDELVAAVLAAGLDDVVLAPLLLEEDAVVVLELLAKVELGEGEMLLDRLKANRLEEMCVDLSSELNSSWVFDVAIVGGWLGREVIQIDP